MHSVLSTPRAFFTHVPISLPAPMCDSAFCRFCPGPRLSLAAQLCKMHISGTSVLQSAANAAKTECSAPSRRQALLFHYFKTLLPTGLAISTGMRVSYSRQTGCLLHVPSVLASLCLSSVFHFTPLPPIL